MLSRLLFVVFLAALCTGPLTARGDEPATPGLDFCNDTQARIWTAIAYRTEAAGPRALGWWELAAGECREVLSGRLLRPKYYVYAYSEELASGERIYWSGDEPFCTDHDAFDLSEHGDCAARGLDRTGFAETDVGRNFRFTQHFACNADCRQDVGLTP